MPIRQWRTEIRAALDRGDYRAADSLHRKVQGHYSENYQPLGQLIISHEGVAPQVSSYERELDLTTAMAANRFNDGKEN